MRSESWVAGVEATDDHRGTLKVFRCLFITSSMYQVDFFLTHFPLFHLILKLETSFSYVICYSKFRPSPDICP